MCSSSLSGFSGSLIDDFSFKTSSILLAETAALGSIIDIIVSIRKDITICIAYVINAVMAPTCMLPLSILCAATHMISTLIPYMINVIRGIINVITRFVKSIVLVSALLASSKRSSSFFSRPNARITERPVRISLDTRLTLSTSFCISLNLGIATTISTITIPIIISTASAIIHSMPAPVCITLKIPPTPSIGAYKTIRSIRTVTSCTCCISLVVRVIRDAVENLSISAFEKFITFLYTLPRKSRPIPAATLEATSPTRTVVSATRSAIAIILAPEPNRYFVCNASISIPALVSCFTAYAIPIDFTSVEPIVSTVSSAFSLICETISSLNIPACDIARSFCFSSSAI